MSEANTLRSARLRKHFQLVVATGCGARDINCLVSGWVCSGLFSRPGLPEWLPDISSRQCTHTHPYGHSSYCHIQLATCVGSVLVAIVEQPSNCTCNWLPGSPKWFYVLWEVTCGNNSHSHSQTLATWHSPTHTHTDQVESSCQFHCTQPRPLHVYICVCVCICVCLSACSCGCRCNML